MSVEAGERAPAFAIETTAGPQRLEERLARGPLVLVFYSEDATPTCSAQLRSFRDEHALLQELDSNVLAVSADELEPHRAFAERLGGLPFPLGSDPELALARAYGVADEEARRAQRAVFVIGTDGRVVQAQPHYQPGAADQFAAVFAALGVEG
ncbi:MAG: redoxin domain-containing protein [Chloroflexi bacterium]|nr:redoxin domain-containing protein [Chloroflexota bacterium]